MKYLAKHRRCTPKSHDWHTSGRVITGWTVYRCLRCGISDIG